MGEELHTMVERRWPRGDRSANTNIHLRIGEPIDAPSSLEIFLSARWGLYTTTRGGSLRYAPISHEPWRLQRAEDDSYRDRLLRAEKSSHKQMRQSSR
ncbi:MAG: hypothetical protein EBU22_07165 [Actinobacteria bacterium]|nr:hypothetical protein [Actinomycetota bacterium]